MHPLFKMRTKNYIHERMPFIKKSRIFGEFAGSFKTDMPISIKMITLGLTLSTTVFVDRCIFGIHYIIEDYKEYLKLCSNIVVSITDAINHKKVEFTSLKKDIHLLYWINFCTGGRLDLHKYHGKYPDDGSCKKQPPIGDKNSTDFYNTAEEQGTALLQYFRPNIILPNEAVKVGIRTCAKGPKVPELA